MVRHQVHVLDGTHCKAEAYRGGRLSVMRIILVGLIKTFDVVLFRACLYTF